MKSFKTIILPNLIGLSLSLVVILLMRFIEYDGLAQTIKETTGYCEYAYNNTTYIELVLTILLGLLIPSIIIFGYYFSKLNFDKITGTLEKIESRKIRRLGNKYIRTELEIVADTLKCILTKNGSENILWELHNLELKKLENDDIEISVIRKRIDNLRRNRITRIANSLIHKNYRFKKSEYLTTETRRPSEIEEKDKKFRSEQIEKLKDKKPVKAQRFLILKKDVLEEELKDENIESLKKFVEHHLKEYDSGKVTILKIIAYQDKIEDVFDGFNVDSFYDFALSKSGNSTTVFAQKEKAISTFDSECNGSESFLNAFTKWYEKMDKYTYDANNDFFISESIYSKSIDESINKIRSFINSLN